MKRQIVSFLLLYIPLAASLVPAPFAQEVKSSEYSNEPFVIESQFTKITFENDGTSSTTSGGRVRVQSQAGVQQFGVLNFPYASGTSSMEIVHVRVIKPDKRVVETPVENVLDMPADITRQAPFYSDIKELQVPVKGLQVGDTLEIEAHEEDKKPLYPGQFWKTFEFFHNGIVLQEQLEVRVPHDRAVQIKSATVQPTITQDGRYRVYTWKTANLKRKPEGDNSNPNEPHPPSVQITTFRNWGEVGQWFQSLFAPKAVPTPDIQAKADELTRNARTQAEKIQDIYAFVSTKFRYIGIGLGIGRYQPHAAADVLSNDYGDCKDKHTLLAALLAAEGVKAYPAFINSQTKIDPDVPSPAQFDHVITAIPQGKGFVFLDATPEVAPFEFLIANLRDKKTLVVAEAGAAELVETPADPPFPSFFKFREDGKLDDSGTLDSKVQMSFRGDVELPYRLALRQAGEPQWKDVMQRVSSSLGFGGTVSDVTASAPDATDTPFDIDYTYRREQYSDWANKRISPPFPPIFLGDAPKEGTQNPKPIELGSPGESDYQAAIKLPADLTPQLPSNVHLSEDFAEYNATYSVSGGVLHAERRLVTKVHEVAPGQIEAYRKFQKAVVDDEGAFIPLLGEAAATAASPDEAQTLFEQGREAWQLHNLDAAADAFRRALNKDPKFVQAWIALGVLHVGTGVSDKGIEELNKAIALDPKQTLAYDALSRALMAEHRPEDAIAAWKQLEKAAPENPDAPAHLGMILSGLKRYSEAVPELEAAVRIDPGNMALLIPLGDAYAGSGEKEKAIATWGKAVQMDSSVNNLNSVAYALADDNLQLDDALKYAEEAVKSEESTTAKIDLNHLAPSDLGTPSHLAAYWDTLGWVCFRLGHLDDAEKYLNAGWHLSQDPVIAGHLGQLYQKQGKPGKASQFGGGVNADQLQRMRTMTLKLVGKPVVHASVEFSILFAPGSKVVAVKLGRGSEKLPGADKALRTAKFDIPFPDEGPVQILRQGILDCEPEILDCTVAFIPTNAMRLAQ